MNPSPRRILSRDFVVVCGLLLLAQGNVAVFFALQGYLESLSFDVHLQGIAIGSFSVAVLAVRLLTGRAVTPRRALPWIAVGTAGCAAALLLYGLVSQPLPFFLLRLFHGAAYGVAINALTARLVVAIPEGRSAQAFGWASVVLLVPFAIFPPLVGQLVTSPGGFTRALSVVAAVFLVTLPAIALFSPLPAAPFSAPRPPSWSDARAELARPEVVSILVLSLLAWGALGAVFFYLGGWGNSAGIAHPGFFLTTSTTVEIAVRLFGGRLLDRLPKPTLLVVSAALLSAGFALLPAAREPAPFLAVAVVCGLGWGIAMPVINGYLFDVTAPRLRPLFTNLGMAVGAAGLAAGPALAGLVVHEAGYEALFRGCAASSLACMAVAGLGFRRGKGGSP